MSKRVPSRYFKKHNRFLFAGIERDPFYWRKQCEYVVSARRNNHYQTFGVLLKKGAILTGITKIAVNNAKQIIGEIGDIITQSWQKNEKKDLRKIVG